MNKKLKALEATSVKFLCFLTKRLLIQMEHNLINEDPLGQAKLVHLFKVAV